MDLDARVLVTGQCDWVGGAIVRRLTAAGFRDVRWFKCGERDLTRQATVEAMFFRERPQYVFLTAAREGAEGSRSGDPLRESLAIQSNVIHAAWRADVRKLCFVASSSVYPAGALPPLRDGALLTTAQEPWQDASAVVQRAGVRMCQVYRKQYRFDAISLVPACLYGPGEPAGAEASAVSGLLRKLYDARLADLPQLVLQPASPQEWLQVDDLADGAVFLMHCYAGEAPVNIGPGEATTLPELAQLIAEIVDYRGHLIHTSAPVHPTSPPAEVTQLRDMGWEPCMPLRQGIEQAYAWWVQGSAVIPA